MENEHRKRYEIHKNWYQAICKPRNVKNTNSMAKVFDIHKGEKLCIPCIYKVFLLYFYSIYNNVYETLD